MPTKPSTGRYLLLCGLREDLLRQVGARLVGKVNLLSVAVDDTLGSHLVSAVDLVLFDLRDGDYLARRIGHMIGEVSRAVPPQTYYLSDHPPSAELMELMPNLRPLSLPIDYSYLLGLLDSMSLHGEKIKHLGREQDRIRLLYEVSSALLKVRDRRHIAPALERSLPKVFPGSLILLTLPESPDPVLYHFSEDGVGPRKLETLRLHLEDAWKGLRPEAERTWEFLDSIATVRASDHEYRLTGDSFVSVPITRGHQTEGFLTFLPKGGKQAEEHTLQTLFLIGDLLSVLIHNLYLKEELERRATRDGLTGLLNRQALFEQLERECQRSNRYGHPFTIVMFDLDHFKAINDTYLHVAGDEALKHVAALVRSSIREVDIAGRCGGEEFIVILPFTDLEGGRIWAERFRRRLDEEPLYFEDKVITITATAGVASTCGPSTNADDLVAMADRALYKGKKMGRNRVVAAVGDEDFADVEGNPVA